MERGVKCARGDRENVAGYNLHALHNVPAIQPARAEQPQYEQFKRSLQEFCFIFVHVTWLFGSLDRCNCSPRPLCRYRAETLFPLAAGLLDLSLGARPSPGAATLPFPLDMTMLYPIRIGDLDRLALCL